MNQIDHIMALARECEFVAGDSEAYDRCRQTLRTAIEQALSNKENIMPITDDHGVATTRQFRVIEQRGRWQLLFYLHHIGNTVHHEFRIQKLRHDIALYPGITLDQAKKRFAEKVEADRE
jgi:hypothetical protein